MYRKKEPHKDYPVRQESRKENNLDQRITRKQKKNPSSLFLEAYN